MAQEVLKVSVEQFRAVLANTKNLRVLRVCAAIICSSEVKAIGGCHIIGSSRWEGNGALFHLSEHKQSTLVDSLRAATQAPDQYSSELPDAI
jgi:hypothetical protein